MAASSTLWTGRLRYTPLLNILIFLFAVACFGLAASYANAVINTPMSEDAIRYERPRPTNGMKIAYALFMPFFTILQSLFDLVLHFCFSLHPIYALVISVIYFTGWLTQWAMWMNCEISAIGTDNGHDLNVCFQADLEGAGYSTLPSKSSFEVVDARVGLGFIVFALYIAYGVMAALAVARKRKAAKGR
ncbi:MAG: hypothetical protein Q9197_005487 [Variospora fuerteventurae]